MKKRDRFGGLFFALANTVMAPKKKGVPSAGRPLLPDHQS
jgi:hypothetical protein